VGVSAAFQDQSGTVLLTNAATVLVNSQQAQHTQVISNYPAILLLQTIHPAILQRSQAAAGVTRLQES